MDVSLSTIAPRVVADQRPAADAAATARIDRPPLAVAPAVSPAPASLSQEGLVTRNALEPGAGVPDVSMVKAPDRVLKPWGILMLPAERPHQRPREDGDIRDHDADAGPSSTPEVALKKSTGPLTSLDGRTGAFGTPLTSRSE